MCEFNWLYLLQHIREQLPLLEELTQKVEDGVLSTEAACVELIRQGFTMVEVLELREIFA